MFQYVLETAIADEAMALRRQRLAREKLDTAIKELEDARFEVRRMLVGAELRAAQDMYQTKQIAMSAMGLAEAAAGRALVAAREEIKKLEKEMAQ
jgi:hypothetical protein